MDIQNFTIKKFHDGLRGKQFSATEVAKAYFRRIAERDGEIGAYLNVMEGVALAQAKTVDEKIAKGENVGALAGVPLAIKDNMLIDGVPATAGSKILENHTAVYDATVIKKLREQNAIFLGKTNLDEFAMGSSTENSAYKKTKNPHDVSRVPGGSSGGSAAAVAGDLALAALGSDTGGSIRQPAGFCGVVGFKPTYGAVSRYGLIAMASSLDQIGPFTKTVEDAAVLFKALTGKDAYDATSVDVDYGDVTHMHDSLKQMTIGIPDEYFSGDGMEPEVVAAVEAVIKTYERLGLKFKKINLPHTKHALSCYYIIMPAEVSSNLARFDGIRYSEIEGAARGVHSLAELYKKTRHHGFGAEVKRRIILGTFVLSSGYYDAYYSKAQKVRALIKEDFDKVFDSSADGVDAILTPVSPTRAFKFGEKTDDPLAMYLSDIFTIPVNLAGLPGISIPCKVAKGALPVGFQLIGKHFHEADILGLGRLYENS